MRRQEAQIRPLAGPLRSVRSARNHRRPPEVPMAAGQGRRRREEDPMEAPQTTLQTDVQAGRALSIERAFTTPGVHPFDTVEWELRTAAVGSFRQDDVEFP